MNEFKTQGYRDELQGVRDLIVPKKPDNAGGGKGDQVYPFEYGTQLDGRRTITKAENKTC